MTPADITIVIVPRERFSYAQQSLDSVYEHTTPPFSLIYVDGHVPARLRAYLQQEAKRRNFLLVHTDHYLSPNQARNLGLQQVHTKYVVFLDNDVLVTPGWLEALVRCAEETEAWVVGPLYLQGPLEEQIVHMAGGTITTEEREGKRQFAAKLNYVGKPLASLPHPPMRGPTDYVEFHCTLVRTEMFGKLGRLDEKLLSSREHLDLCLMVREAGGPVYLEPAAVVTYIYPRSLAWSDLPYFMLRWSEAWNTATLERFQAKWNVQVSDRQMTILRHHRHAYLAPVKRPLRRVFGRYAGRIEQSLLYPVERRLNQLLIRARP